jgi:hypothetical protein
VVGTVQTTQQRRGDTKQTEVKTIAEMIEEREEELNKLEDLKDIQDSEMIEALTQDNQKQQALATPLPIQTSSVAQSQISTDISVEVSSSQVQPQQAYNQEFDLDKLQQEKEREIKGYLDTLNQVKEQIDQMQTAYDKDDQRKKAF